MNIHVIITCTCRSASTECWSRAPVICSLRIYKLDYVIVTHYCYSARVPSIRFYFMPVPWTICSKLLHSTEFPVSDLCLSFVLCLLDYPFVIKLLFHSIALHARFPTSCTGSPWDMPANDDWYKDTSENRLINKLRTLYYCISSRLTDVKERLPRLIHGTMLGFLLLHNMWGM